jgi:putative ABC transport system permease protein
VHVPLGQSPLDVMSLVVRTDRDPLKVVSGIRGDIEALDKDLPLFGVKTLNDYLGQSVSKPRFSAFVLAIFSGMALLLATVGIYGVVSYSVTQRTHEIGIRMALGAERRNVLRLVVKEGMSLALIGVGVGLMPALVLTRFLASMLYGVKPIDPVTFAIVPVILVGVALPASCIPARRPTKVDPLVALRSQ